jgi:small GTP-binding protein
MGGAKHDFMFKLVLIGDTEVGKSQLLLRYTKDQFKRQTPSTIGMEFAMQAVQIQDAVIRAQIWDTAGQERYRAITNTYYRQAIGVLLVYDISRRTSFENLDKWLSEVRDHGDEKVEVILVGNKSDLEKTRQVSKEEAQKYADEHGK